MDKQLLLDTLKNIISEKIQQLDQLIEETRASNNDTKSSMGDKYETGREMLQQEINNLSVQKSEVQKQMDSLSKLNAQPTHKVTHGSLVKTTNAWFYIAASAGPVNFDQQKIMTISPLAPIAVAMMNKIEGEEFSFNNIKQTIVTIL